jgi:hypothetical protein
MNLDDRFDAYFNDRSADIAVTSLGSAAVVARARRRQHRRTGAKVAAVVGVTALGAGVLAQSAGRHEQRVSSAVAQAEPLDWTVVTPPMGLGASTSSATTAEGAVYALSTEPGVPGPGKRGPGHLYRSTDDTGWTDVALPDGLSPQDVAAGGDRVYAIGTAPAGGGGEQVKLASGTGDGRWDTMDLPLDIPALDAAFPGEVRAASSEVATGADGTTVVAVGVQGWLDENELPADVRAAWSTGVVDVSADGIDVLHDPCSMPTTTTTAASSASDGEAVTTSTGAAVTTVPDAKAGSGATGGCDGATDAPTIASSYTWSELGVDPAVGALAVGRTYLYASSGDGPFEEVAQLPSTHTWATEITSTSEGFWLSYPSETTGDQPVTSTTVVRSADGRSWDTDAAVEIPGDILAAGVLGGSPAVLTRGSTDGRPVLSVLGTSGVAQTVDVADALGDAVDATNAVDAAIGPMGIALVLYPPPTELADPLDGGVVAFSPDGSAWTSEELPPAPDGRAPTLGQGMVSVSADAVTVRLNSYEPGATRREGTVPQPEQRVLVGTP